MELRLRYAQGHSRRDPLDREYLGRSARIARGVERDFRALPNNALVPGTWRRLVAAFAAANSGDAKQLAALGAKPSTNAIGRLLSDSTVRSGNLHAHALELRLDACAGYLNGFVVAE